MAQKRQERSMLIVPLSEAQTRISERIEEGRKLLELSIGNETELRQAQDEGEKWSDYNAKLLRWIVDTDELVDDYYPPSGYFIEPSPSFAGRVKTFRIDVKDSITRLESILQCLPLMVPESPTLAQPAEAQPIDSRPEVSRRVFVVHGRNLKARDAMFTFLRSIGLRPLEWSEAVLATGEGSPYIGKILDTAFSCAQAVVVLMTPDDEACLRAPFRKPEDPLHETQLTPQARPNVIFEAGMAMGRFPDRTILVELGFLRPFSDIGGRHVIRLNNTTQKRQQLAHRLETGGCPIDLHGIDWHTAGDFEIDVEEEQTERTLEDNFRPGLYTRTTGGFTQKIDFDYPPGESPLEHGWTLEGARPAFEYPVDGFFGKVIAIQQVKKYALDYDVRHDARRLGKVVEFVAKLDPGAAIYAHVNVQSKDHSISEKVWIQFRVETRSPRRAPDHDDEWIIYIMPTPFKGNWQLFRIDLIDAVNQTFGNEGWSFGQLIGLRLRGNLDLAYIAVFES